MQTINIDLALTELGNNQDMLSSMIVSFQSGNIDKIVTKVSKSIEINFKQGAIDNLSGLITSCDLIKAQYLLESSKLLRSAIKQDFSLPQIY